MYHISNPKVESVRDYLKACARRHNTGEIFTVDIEWSGFVFRVRFVKKLNKPEARWLAFEVSVDSVGYTTSIDIQFKTPTLLSELHNIAEALRGVV